MPTRMVPRNPACAACTVMPYASAAPSQMAPIRASMTGYWIEIGAPQLRQRPRRASQENTGMLSYQAIRLPHLGQVDGGASSDWSAGSRRMQTFRKLPSTSPNSATTISSTVSTPTQDLVQQDSRRDGDVERLGALRQRNRSEERRVGKECRSRGAAQPRKE